MGNFGDSCLSSTIPTLNHVFLIISLLSIYQEIKSLVLKGLVLKLRDKIMVFYTFFTNSGFFTTCFCYLKNDL